MLFAFWNIRMRATTDGYLGPCCWRKTKWKEAKRIIVKLIELKKRECFQNWLVISIEIQKSGKEVLLPLSRLWGKEQGVERAFPLRAFTRRPCTRQPCSASTVHRQGWGLWEAAGWDLLWAKPQWSSPGDRAGVPTAQHSASCSFILWYHAMQSCKLVLNSILKNILFLECFESSLALKIRSKKGSRGTKSPDFKYCYFENDS